MYPQYQPWIYQPKDVLQLSIFLFVALIINLLTSNFLKSKQKIQQLSQKLAQENAEQLRMALSAAQMGMWDWDIVTGEIKWSPEHEELFGLAVGTFDGKYETFAAYLHPDDRSALNQAVQQALQTHSIYQHEYRIIWADGSIHWLEARGNAFYDAAGQPIRMTGTVMAIDQHKEAQAALRQSEERYRTLFNSIDEGFCILEMLFDENDTPLDYRFLEVNPIFEKQTGLKQAVGKTARQLVPNLEQDWFEIYGKVALTGESIRFEHGSAAMNRWFDVYALRIGPQSSRKVALVFTEISDRKQAEMALQQMNTELEQHVAERTAQLTEVNDRLLATLMEQHQARQLLEEQAQLLDLAHDSIITHDLNGAISFFAHDSIITHDLNGAISFWNRGAEYMYGWKKAEVLGEILHTFLKTQYPQPLAEIEAELSNKGYWEGELIHFSRDAQPITVGSRWVLQTDNTGKPIKILEINNDITERKQAELALSQSEERRRLALDLTHTAFWDLHLPSKNMVWNDNHFTLLGLVPYSVEPSYEVWHNRIHPEDVGWVEQIFLEARTDYTAEYRVVHPDGSVHWMMGRGRAIYDESGQPLRSVGVLLDISDRKQAEQLLELQAVITRNMAEGIGLVRADNGVIVYANPKFEQMFGYDSGELNGQHVSIVNYASESVTAEDVNQAIRSAVLQKGEATYEVHNVKKDGTPFWCSASCSVFKHPDYGDVLVAVHQDITDRKRIRRCSGGGSPRYYRSQTH